MQPEPDRDIGAALAAAPPEKLGRIVGLLDSLQARGAADALLAAARPRLKDLRPDRPMRFTRLLAVPLEPALVAPEAWTRAPIEIPRSALTPIGDAVRGALGLAADEIEAAALGRTMADAALVARLGARLWPLAAGAVLPAIPPGWEAAGLPAASAAPVLALCRALWRGPSRQPAPGG
ncbi:hypothetical protein DFH01_06745 [Falsiroseomonas bella]|uniref:Uncharacterized protein n=1 Tax=Falsiroseomonas bella TaxID=2184016 RepID=A0A317FLV9_9PROT|nr:hypothetical protein [Falsiroseomonas bella]PWS38939.1 hypothetical protein DFH01_06745 [Falsiroseomonas bella]